MAADPHQPLRDDVRQLGELLGQVLREHEGEDLFLQVEQVREAAKRARSADVDLETVGRLLHDLPIASALTVSRAFAHFLNLANIAEQHHRIRRRRAYQRDPFAPPRPAVSAKRIEPVPAAPVAPPVPWRYLGTLVDESGTSVYVIRGEEPVLAAPGATLAGEYRVESVTASAVTLLYLPLGTRHALAIAGRD